MSQFWKIEESVGQYYIVLDGIFDTRAAAVAHAAKLPSNQNMRIVLYETGQYGDRGAVRASERRI